MKDLIAYLKAGDWILVKGSRGMAMEEVVKGLIEVREKKTELDPEIKTVH
jgi:hypothetical protein